MLVLMVMAYLSYVKECIERCYGCLSETFRFKMFLIISDKHALNKVNVIKMVA